MVYTGRVALACVGVSGSSVKPDILLLVRVVCQACEEVGV